jgi:hypothetical protein
MMQNAMTQDNPLQESNEPAKKKLTFTRRPVRAIGEHAETSAQTTEASCFSLIFSCGR